MRWLKFLVLSPLVFLSGCIYVHEGNSLASREEIASHLRQQIHAETLELRAEGRDQFAGSGRNGNGPFTILVKRDHDKITFEGVYTGSAHGGFSGSWTWSREFRATLGFQGDRSTNESTFSAH